MSSHFIVLIPRDPRMALPDDGGEALCSALVAATGSEEARVKSYDERVRFVDCGENFESVACPDCGAELDTGWWRDAMNHCFDQEKGFNLHPHPLPCCGTSRSLDELVYAWPQGFATWFVSARSAGTGPLGEDAFAALEHLAGFPLRLIYQMY